MFVDKFIFRKATKEDIALVYAVYKSVIGEEFCVWNDAYPDMLEIEGDLGMGNLFVMADNDKITGAISIVPENELDNFSCWTFKEGAEIARVVVSKEYRGCALSYKMVQNVADILRERNFRAIHLSVAKANIPAYKTYIKAGFASVGEARMYGRDYYLMEIEL